MKRYLIATTTLLVVSFSALGQSSFQLSQSEMQIKIKHQAFLMAKTLIAGDFKEYVSFINPIILKSSGGADGMIAVLNKMAEQLRLKGMTISTVTFDNPGNIVKNGSEFQTTIVQHTTIAMNPGRIVITSALIPISTDNGSNWTFIDASNKDISSVRALYPHLSASITIPPPQKPVRYAF